ncbi:MAG: tetratricopeptide repeat protein [Planctomycetes bacterium]|nr:tetratricopeptide repeat protein [Planctomycetota bacterium]
MPFRLSAYLLCLFSFLLLSSCAIQQPIYWDPDSNTSITHFQKPVCAENDKNYGFWELARGDLFFAWGDRQHSDSRLRNGLQVMNQIESDSREDEAVILNECLRTYRGFPYERAAAFFYRGICQFQLGHYSNALAAFRAALAEDLETHNDDPAVREDFIAAYYMAALCHKCLGEPEEAEANLRSARARFPDHPLLQEGALEGNLVVLGSVGIGPWKEQGAFWTIKVRAGVVPTGRLEMHCNEKLAGELHEVTDFLVQADSHKAGKATGAAVARAVGKEVVNAFLSALAGRDAGLHEKRDLRCWQGMPRKFYIGTFSMPPGLHTLTFDFAADGAYEPAPSRYKQTWYDIPVGSPGNPPRLLYVRLLSDYQNLQGFTRVSLEDSLAAKADSKKK